MLLFGNGSLNIPTHPKPSQHITKAVDSCHQMGIRVTETRKYSARNFVQRNHYFVGEIEAEYLVTIVNGNVIADTRYFTHLQNTEILFQ